MKPCRFGPFRLDPAARELRRDDERVALPPRVFACLLYLVEQRERAVSRDELIAALWEGRSASDVQLAQLIVQCRRAVGDDGQEQRAIRTVAGFGYRWIEPVQVEDADASTSPHTSVARSPIEHTPSDDERERVAARGEALVARAPRRRTGVLLVSVALAGVVALLIVVATVYRRVQPAAKAVAGFVLVGPVAVADTDARWLRLGGMDVVIDRLRWHQVPVLSSEATVALLQADPVSADADDAQRLTAHAEALRAAGVFAITAARSGAGWRMTSTLRTGASAARSETVERDDPLQALQVLADRASGALGHPVAEPDARREAGPVAVTLQQARAALLANDPERARALLQADPALVANEPLLRQQLADVDIRAGRYAEAQSTLDALLADGGADADFRARLFVSRGMVAIRTGRFDVAGSDFSAALGLLEGEADPITHGRAWLGRGISRTSLQDYTGAQADYAQARGLFDAAGDAGSVARVDSDIGALEILRGHLAQADAYLQRALDRFHALGLVQEEINALQLTFVARRGRLRNADAAAAIERAWAERARIVSPSSRLSTGLYRVESLLVLGRDSEARTLLDALDGSAHAAAGAEQERWQLMRAEQQVAAGEWDDASATLAPLSAAPHPSADDDSVRAAVGLLQARARRLHREDGERPASGTIETPTPRTPLRLLADANRAWARDDAAAADTAFAVALRLADEQGIEQTLAAVVRDDVDYLLGAGRVAEAAAVATRVALWADQDFDCALVQLRVAHAARDVGAWTASLERVRRLAGEREVPAALTERPR